jgi:hypothetical protein
MNAVHRAEVPAVETVGYRSQQKQLALGQGETAGPARQQPP